MCASNDQHLDTPQRKRKLKGLRQRATRAEQEVKHLQEAITNMVVKGVLIYPVVSQDLVHIMEENSDKIKEACPGSFRHLLWDQQLRAAQAKATTGIRWHPVMIRWALNLKMISSAAYHSENSWVH